MEYEMREEEKWLREWVKDEDYEIHIDELRNTNLDERLKKIVVNRGELLQSYMIYRMEKIEDKQIRQCKKVILSSSQKVIDGLIEEIRNDRLIVIDESIEYEGIWDIKKLKDKYEVMSNEDIIEYVEYNIEEYQEYMIEKLKRVNKYDIRKEILDMIKISDKKKRGIERIKKMKKERVKRRKLIYAKMIACKKLEKREEGEEELDDNIKRQEREHIEIQSRTIRRRVKHFGNERRKMIGIEDDKVIEIGRFGVGRKVRKEKNERMNENKRKIEKLRIMKRNKMIGGVMEKILKGVEKNIKKERYTKRKEKGERRIMMKNRERVNKMEIGNNERKRKEMDEKKKNRGKKMVVRNEMELEIDEMKGIMKELLMGKKI